MGLIAEVVSQLDLHRPFDQPLGQLRQQPARPGDLLLGLRALKQLVDHLVRDLLAIVTLDHLTQSRVRHGVIDLAVAHTPSLLRSRRGRRRLA